MQRVITAIALIPVALYLVFFAPNKLFFAAAVAMSLLCYWEYSGLVAAYGIRRPGLLGVFSGLVILFRPTYTLLGVTLFVAVALVLFLKKVDLRQILPQVACALFGAFYTFAPWRFSVDLRKISVHLLFFALAVNWLGDTAAYYAGRAIGRHPMAPVISPKKTWEGAAASVFVSVVAGVLYLGHFIRDLPYWEIVLMAVLANIAGQFGDLVESAIKRGAGVKDSGHLLPGHGGMLDRVDSSLFSLPFVFGVYLFCDFFRQFGV
ncbi:MAG TPA: phosphatidate cytidylyltransferase [Bryobacteraceae bacterium]|nr:phosphatidate cytidylyltransferase [Bryobacteraceae bacterium]